VAVRNLKKRKEKEKKKEKRNHEKKKEKKKGSKGSKGREQPFTSLSLVAPRGIVRITANGEQSKERGQRLRCFID